MRTLLALLAMITQATAGAVEFEYEKFQMTSTGRAEIILKFTNNTGEYRKYVTAECAILDSDNSAISVVAVAVKGVPDGGVAYGKGYGPRDARAEHLSCRIDD